MGAPFVFDEIRRQPELWEQTLTQGKQETDRIRHLFHQLQVDEVILTGCGTSYYLAITAAAVFQEWTIPSRAIPASEMLLVPDTVLIPGTKTLVIAASRSGSTTEVVKAVQRLRSRPTVTTWGLTCHPDSPLTQAAHQSWTLPHAKEKSVVMTGSFTSMLLFLQWIAATVAKKEGPARELQHLPTAAAESMSAAHTLGQQLGADLRYDHLIYLGLGAYYGLACEGMLKAKEMTQVVCEAYNPLEFRHGPLSVLREGCRVFLLSQQRCSSQEQAVARDLRALNADVVVLAEDAASFDCDRPLPLPAGFSDAARCLLYLPLLQWVAYYRTLQSGLHPDRPRHLDQVVILPGEGQ
ncbi:glutamine--fructose-6-phosphate aminotransferase [Marinithermofilum abyssi]|uniref:Glutamine--fructose-6-phosphate aminotransferase n=1 Tax=Marinithermofilum abyssi TaxID=1571185 RepID=A0A8J2VJR2_9BACL|nr:SIS domain-containing protein [Marinithermofilum abyssi]GGE26363.1 glutamine--fructose-6-phosphate aminotransferase [Marinithermofilum abyssi]